MRIKLTLTALLLTLGVTSADPVRLFLIPRSTLVEAHAEIVLDAYIWNSSQQVQHVPSLDLISTVASWKNSGAAESSGKTTTHNPPDEILPANGVKHMEVKTNLSAETGDLIEVYVEVGAPSQLRSNSVLLYCEPAHKGHP